MASNIWKKLSSTLKEYRACTTIWARKNIPDDRVENYVTCHSFFTATYGTIT